MAFHAAWNLGTACCTPCCEKCPNWRSCRARRAGKACQKMLENLQKVLAPLESTETMITRNQKRSYTAKNLPRSQTSALQLCHELKHCASARFPLEELLTRRQLLRNHARCGDHCKAAIVELLGLHFFELFRIRRLQTQGVPSKVPATRSVFIDQGWPPKGDSKLKTEKISGMAIAVTTAGQKVCSGVCWKAMYEGTSTLPPKRG